MISSQSFGSNAHPYISQWGGFGINEPGKFNLPQQIAVDDKIQTGDEKGLQEIILVLVGLLVVHAAMQFLQSYMANWLGQSVILNIRRKLFSHVVSFKLKYFDTSPIGTLVTRVTSDIQTIAEVFSSGLLNIISEINYLVILVHHDDFLE